MDSAQAPTRLERNQNGGIYQHGKQYDVVKKTTVAQTYLDLQSEALGGQPSLNKVAKLCGVCRSYVRKVEKELQEHGAVIAPKMACNKKKRQTKVPGARTLTAVDVGLLLDLRRDSPNRTLRNYKKELFDRTGTVVSETTISDFFTKRFEFKGSLRRPNLMPYDKFTPENLTKAREYIQIIKSVNPKRLKFGGERYLKGEDVWSPMVWADPETGEVPTILTAPDFRTAYSIIGLCGIDRGTSPVFYNMYKGSVDATCFREFIEEALGTEWLVPGDILVIDNTRIQGYGENGDWEDWLWDSYEIYVLFLPAHTPEFNPLELVWRTLVTRLGGIPLSYMRQFERDVPGHLTIEVLDSLTHEDVEYCYAAQNYGYITRT